MKLHLKNIAKIKQADVVIDGITVIAGENDTGKSTVGKTLFVVYHSFYNINERVKEERLESLVNWLGRIYVNAKGRPLRRIDEKVMATEILEHAEEYRQDDSDSFKMLTDLIRKYDEELVANLNADILKNVSKNVRDILDITDTDFFINVIEKNFLSEFNGQICNIYNKKEGTIDLQLENQSISIGVTPYHLRHLTLPFLDIHSAVTYIDNPFILDDYRLVYFDFSIGSILHQTQLRKKLFLQNEKGNQFDLIADREKLKTIDLLIAKACSGEIIFDKQRYTYIRKESGVALDVHNLSAGLKTFAILKMLLQNGGLEQNGTLILDEPEIHLHPQWQLLFAEIIVLLQKEFDLHILLNTHSPYFLRAIQVYAAKYNRADLCRYYMTELDGDLANIVDVTDCIDKAYAKLATPFQQLEDERAENDRLE